MPARITSSAPGISVALIGQVVAQLWASGLRAELMPRAAPTLSEQYDFAEARGIR
jgi:hypothetical protein